MDFSENSRVWIYQADRAFTAAEQEPLQEVLRDFTRSWSAHGNALAAGFELRHDRFIVLFVDEAQAGATGCSIDKSVKLMKAIEQEFGVNLFDRFQTAYKGGDEIRAAGRTELEALIRSGAIDEDTIVFNNLVQTKKELDQNWEIPFKASWHARVFAMPQAR